MDGPYTARGSVEATVAPSAPEPRTASRRRLLTRPELGSYRPLIPMAIPSLNLAFRVFPLGL
jgi:hypothetical protein